MKHHFIINKRLEKLVNQIQIMFSKTKPAYFYHTLRVANYSYQIAQTENVDLEIVIASALIHDIGRITKPSFKEHINGTKELGYELLLECGYSKSEIQNIIQIAVSHHPKKEELLKDIYQQILFDADNLDSVGAFGILRWYVNISSELKYMIEDAKLYIDCFSVTNRNKFFYTKYSQDIGERLIAEGINYARNIITFCENSINQNPYLKPISINDIRD